MKVNKQLILLFSLFNFLINKMLGITGVCYRLIGDLVQAIGVVSKSSSSTLNVNIVPNSSSCDCEQQQQQQQEAVPQEVDDLMLRALTSVFGMENNGKINKERARKVVEKLGLMYGEDGKSSFDLPGGGILEDEVPVEEALGKLEEGSKRNELLREAFKIFDEDGNGYIDAAELKRVLECLGLDKGWDMVEIEKMLKVVDLNLDGRVDFGEFELMMMMG